MKAKKKAETETVEELKKAVELEGDFYKSLRAAEKAALSNASGWKEILEGLGVNPLSDGEKEAAKKLGMPIPTGAFPAEYNRVLSKLVKDFSKKLQREIVSLKSKEAIKRLNAVLIDLDLVHRDALKQYVGLSKPKLSVSNIFDNAAPSLNQYSKFMTEEKSYAIKCKTCGAARLEEDQYDVCFYCGTKLF